MEDKLNLFKDYEKQDNVKLNQLKSDSDKLNVSLKILGLKNFSSLSKLKKQYKHMVKKFHPDLNKSGSNEKIIELNEAYSALIKFLKNNTMSILKKDAESKIPDITISSKKVFNINWDIQFSLFF